MRWLTSLYFSMKIWGKFCRIFIHNLYERAIFANWWLSHFLAIWSDGSLTVGNLYAGILSTKRNEYRQCWWLCNCEWNSRETSDIRSFLQLGTGNKNRLPQDPYHSILCCFCIHWAVLNNHIDIKYPVLIFQDAVTNNSSKLVSPSAWIRSLRTIGSSDPNQADAGTSSLRWDNDWKWNCDQGRWRWWGKGK